MMRGKQALDAFDAGPDGRVDLAALDGVLAPFGEAVRDMDDYAAAHPRALGAFASFPDDLLSHMREVQGRLKRTRGNLAHSAGLDMTFIQSDWNTMVTTSDLPLAIQADDVDASCGRLPSDQMFRKQSEPQQYIACRCLLQGARMSRLNGESWRTAAR